MGCAKQAMNNACRGRTVKSPEELCAPHGWGSAEHTVFPSVLSVRRLDGNLPSVLAAREESRFMRVPLLEKHEHRAKPFITS